MFMLVNKMKNYVSNSLMHFNIYLKSIGIDPGIHRDTDLDDVFFAYDNMYTDEINTIISQKPVSDAFEQFQA